MPLGGETRERGIFGTRQMKIHLENYSLEVCLRHSTFLRIALIILMRIYMSSCKTSMQRTLEAEINSFSASFAVARRAKLLSSKRLWARRGSFRSGNSKSICARWKWSGLSCWWRITSRCLLVLKLNLEGKFISASNSDYLSFNEFWLLNAAHD